MFPLIRRYNTSCLPCINTAYLGAGEGYEEKRDVIRVIDVGCGVIVTAECFIQVIAKQEKRTTIETSYQWQ